LISAGAVLQTPLGECLRAPTSKGREGKEEGKALEGKERGREGEGKGREG